LLQAALRKGTFDVELDAPTRQALAKFLTAYGDLGQDGQFHGTARAGLASPPGATPHDVQRAVARAASTIFSPIPRCRSSCSTTTS
jgi:monoamine oxidase